MGNGNILIPLQRLEDLETNLKDIAIPLLKDDWTEDNGAYKQTVLVEGLKTDSTPSIMLSTVGEATEEELNAYACLDRYEVEDDSITFIASEIPSISFTVIAKGVIASEGQAIADVTALVGRVSELETESDVSGEYQYISLTFSSGKNTSGLCLAFLPLANSDKYNITITRAMIVGSGSVLSSVAIAEQNRLGVIITSDGDVAGKTINFNFSIVKKSN